MKRQAEGPSDGFANALKPGVVLESFLKCAVALQSEGGKCNFILSLIFFARNLASVNTQHYIKVKAGVTKEYSQKCPALKISSLFT